MTENPVCGILHFGELGTSLARLLIQQGCPVVTTTVDRSADTRARAVRAGVHQLPSVPAVISESEIVFSLVHPAASVGVATEFLQVRSDLESSCLFVDGNSIGPLEVEVLRKAFESAGADWVDMTIHGTADRLGDKGVAYLSGRRGPEMESLLGSFLRTVVVSETAGDASLFKQTLASFSKTLNALFLESAILASQNGLFELFLQEFMKFYPGVYPPIERMLPSFCQHVDRRVTELKNIETMARQHEASSHLATAAARFFEAVKNNLKTVEFDSGESPEEKIRKILSKLTAT